MIGTNEKCGKLTPGSRPVLSISSRTRKQDLVIGKWAEMPVAVFVASMLQDHAGFVRQRCDG